MNDIVERLRHSVAELEIQRLCWQAADEIERLRAVAQARASELRAAGADVITELRVENERLRELIKQMQVMGRAVDNIADVALEARHVHG